MHVPSCEQVRLGIPLIFFSGQPHSMKHYQRVLNVLNKKEIWILLLYLAISWLYYLKPIWSGDGWAGGRYIKWCCLLLERLKRLSKTLSNLAINLVCVLPLIKYIMAIFTFTKWSLPFPNTRTWCSTIVWRACTTVLTWIGITPVFLYWRNFWKWRNVYSAEH